MHPGCPRVRGSSISDGSSLGVDEGIAFVYPKGRITGIHGDVLHTEQPVGKRQLWWAIAAISVLAVALVPGPGEAQGPHRAALVVDFGDGRIVVRLVEFAEESITGVELLQRSGLDVALLPGFGIGTALCAIEGVGCLPMPQECFCACRGTPCRYWSYFQWSDAGWIYSPVGAGERHLRDGDADGWVWGDGKTPPGLATWEEMLAQAAAPTPTPTSPAPPATPSPSLVPTVPPSPTVSPSATPALRMLSPTEAVPSPIPSATPLPTAVPSPAAPEKGRRPLRVSLEAWAFGGTVLVFLALWLWVRRRR